MSVNINRVEVGGSLGRDPELRYTATGTAQCTFSVATSRNRKNAAGTWDKETEWFNVVTWGTDAEKASERLHKGSGVLIEGRIQTRSWDKDGVKQYRTEVVAERVHYLDKAPAGDGRWGDDAPKPPPQAVRGQGARQQTASDPDDLPWE